MDTKFFAAMQRIMIVADPEDVRVIVENANAAVRAEREARDSLLDAAIADYQKARAECDALLGSDAAERIAHAATLAERERCARKVEEYSGDNPRMHVAAWIRSGEG